MKAYTLFLLGLLMVAARTPMMPETTPQQTEPVLKKYQGKARVLLVFAPVEESPFFLQQRGINLQARTGYRERAIAVLEVFQREGRDTSGPPLTRPQVESLRKQFGVKIDGFTVVLLGKDGGEKLRQTRPVASEELFRLIDSMPMRQQEMRRQ